MIIKIVLFLLLVIGFVLMFVWLAQESIIHNVLSKTYDTMDAAARRRVHERRRQLILMQNQKGYLYKTEQKLIYSGLIRRFPNLTPELWIAFHLVVLSGIYFGIIFLSGTMIIAMGGVALVLLIWYFLLSFLIGRNYIAVNNNLLKFLDFLGNYSITAGEVTGIFNQISKYVEEPLKSVLEECYYEAQTSGDVSLALLVMAEKIEHPKFKELIRNIEISTRYSADFTLLVSNSRRAVREHLKSRQERKALINEALIQMMILAGMSVFILIAVEQLIEVPIWSVLLHTIIGRMCLCAILVIFILLYIQVRNINK